jgi:hypothetical protein
MARRTAHFVEACSLTSGLALGAASIEKYKYVDGTGKRAYYFRLTVSESVSTNT